MPYVLPKTDLEEFKHHISEDSELHVLLTESVIEHRCTDEILDELKALAKATNQPISIIEECVDEQTIHYESGELPIYVITAKPDGKIIMKPILFTMPEID